MVSGSFRLSEAFREGLAPAFVSLLLLCLLCSVSSVNGDTTFTIASNYGQNCTKQLQCGDKGLVCMEGICQYCQADSDCIDNVQSLYRCNTNNVDSATIINYNPELVNGSTTLGLCKHKALLKPLSWKDILTVLICFVGSCVAAGAGVGGGGLNVAMLVFIDGFTATTAIPLSSVMIGGAAVANFVHALRLQRLTAPRPLIDYHTVFLLQPLTMGGSIIGILLNRWLPDWLILVILVVIIIYTVYTTVIKFIKVWKQDHGSAPVKPQVVESLENHQEMESLPMDSTQTSTNGFRVVKTDMTESENEGDGEAVRLDFDSGTVSPGSTPTKPPKNSSPTQFAVESDHQLDGGVAEPDAEDEEKIRNALELYETKIPVGKLIICFVILFGITLHSIFLGGKGGPSVVGIRTCSAPYWIVLWGIFPFLFIGSWFIGRDLVDRYHHKIRYGFQFLDSDIEWTPQRTYVTMAVAVGAGLVSSLLGVGGGMLVNPLLLTLGVAPDCTAATSSLMILFTAISAIAQYAILGRIQWDYGVLLLVLGTLGSIIGQHVLAKIVKKYKSQSYILLAMLLIIAPGGILLIINAVSGLVKGIQAGAGIGFKNLCGN